MSPRCSDRFTVLVVDDDPSVLSTYRRLLCRAGYRTLTADDPREVLRNGTAESGVDLLLVDYKMPGMDGLNLLAELRRREFSAHVILLSAFLNDDVRAQARALGVNVILEKPVDACALRGAIQDLLPLHGGGQASAAG